MSINNSENLGVAFGMVIGAGASTCIGASVVFFPSLVKYASRKTLAAGLGLSAGVMTYVSFIEIFQKSVQGFVDHGEEDNMASVYATVCFFCGVFLMVLLNMLVHWLLAGSHGHHHRRHHDHPHDHQTPDFMQTTLDANNNNDANGNAANNVNDSRDDDCKNEEAGNIMRGENDNPNEKASDDGELSIEEGECPMPPCCAQDPAAQLEKMQAMSQDIEHLQHDTQARKHRQTEEIERDDDGARLSQAEAKRLHMMSLNTAVAIALHNFPEGLATFVAALADPSVGAVLAIAIAIHNIPEGLCVSLPVYYATGNRCKAFMWACISGISEPIAALLGWAVLANSFSNQTYGILFGLVSGMMVIISVRELLPTAHRYDNEDSVVSLFFMFGMAIMALSLVLFQL